EDFDRRYAEMRSNNDLIGTIGQAILFLIYGLIGAGLGIFFLMKQRFILWKKALYWSVGIGLGTGLLYTFNVLPLLWMDYDTSQSTTSFLGQQLMSGLLQTILMGSIVFVSALAGEGLGRFLFKDQVQLWKVWGKEAGASVQVLGQTVGAYLFVPVFLAIDIVYYLFTTNTLGWWNPAGTLSDPNILAQHLPWYGSIAISVQAGFWEELICRAVPLAGVYFLVHKLKSKDWWMLLALLLQTIIFGMLHANYPQSPAFARVFEMVIPFLIFGLIYLRFGLLPVIIAHYAIDVFWISLPLWVATSEGIWINRIIILVLFFLPLLVVFYWRMKNKQWNNAPLSVRNRAFQPAIQQSTSGIAEKVQETQPYAESKFLKLRYLFPGALMGLLLWAFFTFPLNHQTPEVNCNRSEALAKTGDFLDKTFGVSMDEWSVLSTIDEHPELSHKFVWQEYESDYMRLQQSFLSPPKWKVRVLKKDGTVEERSEEFLVEIGVDGRLLAYRHNWPEKRPGDNLAEDAVLAKALLALKNFSIEKADQLEVVSLTPSKLESRTDWLIEFSDTLTYDLKQGQGRYQVSLAGSEVNGLKQYVFVPETWERDLKKQQSTLKILVLISNLFRAAIIVLGIVIGFINWSRKRFSVRMFMLFASALLLLSVIDLANSWNDIAFKYFTGLPYSNFLAMTLIGALIGLVFLSLGVGVIGGFSCEMARNDAMVERPLAKAFLLGILWTGLQAAINSLNPQVSPDWALLSPLNAELPWLSVITGPWTRFVFYPAFTLVLFYLAGRMTKNGQTLNILPITFIFIAGFVASGIQANLLESWLLTGACGGTLFTLFFLLIRKHLNWIPMIFVVPLVFQEVNNLIEGQSIGMIIGAIFTMIFLVLAAWLWYRGIVSCNQSTITR
ncbi:MAG: CPBP family intramembrane metalloprotease, partial [Prolixibacteraceae bacterium]|nr:CPBP family intramembrane metalloprotease [Prolixibacteraceae bacterium]